MNLVYFRPHVCFQNLIQKEASYAFYEEKKSLKFKNFFGTSFKTTFSFITSRRIELETPGWNQIVEVEKLIPDLMYFLKFD